jgi:tRNA1Val (adenine37-N6)-methyltransferase
MEAVPSLDASELTDDALTERVRVLQRRGGHRYSIDDVVTAWVAVAAGADAAETYLDLGCGLGSVLLMVADRLPRLWACGLEAQAQSFALAEHNVQRNALGARVRVLLGDLRAREAIERVRALAAELGGGFRGFDLITGTPPYKPLGSATPSPDPQRAHARVELRGGVEAYLAAAGQLLSPAGTCVVCMESAADARVRAGALAAGLSIQAVLPVIPMAGRKGRLFSVYRLGREPAEALQAAPLVLRDALGARTPAAHALRAFFGLSIDPSEPPSPALRPRAQRAAGGGSAPTCHEDASEGVS